MLRNSSLGTALGEGDKDLRIWWLLATACLYEYGQEFTPNSSILEAIVSGDIQLFERHNKNGMPSFRASIKGDNVYAPARKGNVSPNGQ